MSGERKMMYSMGQSLWFWRSDASDPVHPEITVFLDSEIDGDQLLSAWKKTMKVYPLLDWIPELVGGEVVFYEADTEPVVVHTEGAVRPCSPLAAGRAFAVAWSGNHFTLTSYHSILDGAGVISVLSTLLYHYCSLHYHQEFDPAGFELREGRKTEENFCSAATMDLGKFEMQPMVLPLDGKTIFSDPGMAPSAPGQILASSVTVDSEKFMQLCRENGATPAIMLSMLFGKAICSLFPEDRRELAFEITTDGRKGLGKTGFLGALSSSASIWCGREDLEERPLEETAKKLRSLMNAQRTEDYAKTQIAIVRNNFILKMHLSGTVSYEGSLHFGSIEEHIAGISLCNHSFNTVHMVELKGNFLIFFQLGGASDRYREAFVKELEKLGVHAGEQKAASAIPAERSEREGEQG